MVDGGVWQPIVQEATYSDKPMVKDGQYSSH